MDFGKKFTTKFQPKVNRVNACNKRQYKFWAGLSTHDARNDSVDNNEHHLDHNNKVRPTHLS